MHLNRIQAMQDIAHFSGKTIQSALHEEKKRKVHYSWIEVTKTVRLKVKH